MESRERRGLKVAMMTMYRFRFFFDFGAGCLWSDNDAAMEKFGYSVDDAELPLTKATVTEIQRIGEWVWRSINPSYPPDPALWLQDECDRFNESTANVLATLRLELGSEFEIVDEQERMMEDPELEQYLANPKGFRRCRTMGTNA